jgi:hypothetical protein
MNKLFNKETPIEVGKFHDTNEDGIYDEYLDYNSYGVRYPNGKVYGKIGRTYHFNPKELTCQQLTSWVMMNRLLGVYGIHLPSFMNMSLKTDTNDEVYVGITFDGRVKNEHKHYMLETMFSPLRQDEGVWLKESPFETGRIDIQKGEVRFSGQLQDNDFVTQLYWEFHELFFTKDDKLDIEKIKLIEKKQKEEEKERSKSSFDIGWYNHNGKRKLQQLG